MPKPFQIGITGGIGSGKSLVCRIMYCAYQIPVYDADSRAKWLMQNDENLRQHIQEAFGKHAYLPDGSLNRTYLAEHVFHSPTNTQRLNALVHPRVMLDYMQWLEANQHQAFLLREAALLIESGAHHNLDYLVVVTAPEEVRIQRVLARDRQRSRQQVEAIIQRQMPEQDKIRFAHFVIHNDGQQALLPQIWQLYKELLILKGHSSISSTP